MKKNQLSILIILKIFLKTPIEINVQSITPITPSKLLRSDIPFSTRWHWSNHLLYPRIINGHIIPPKINDIEEINTIANSVLWTYKVGTNRIDLLEPASNTLFPEFASPKLIQYAVPLYINKKTNIDDPILVDKMVAKNLCGDSLRSTWEIEHGWQVFRPDYNSPEFLTYQIDNIEKLVDDSNISFHQDNAGGNETSLDFRGSFSEDSITKFRDWLMQNLLNIDIQSLGIGSLSNFNYKDHIIQVQGIGTTGVTEEQCNCLFSDLKESPLGTPAERLKYYFRDFQKDETKNYYNYLHTAINNYVASKNFVGIIKGTYSANNHERNKWLGSHFDFWVSELCPKDNNESLIYNITEIARFGRSAFYETNYNIGDVVDSITVARTEVNTNKNSIALSYASGMTMIAPWDVYIDPFNGPQPRFYGKASDYADLLSFVRNNKNLFYATKENLTLLRNSAPKNIPKESKIKIGDNIFITDTTATGVGNIFSPIVTRKDITIKDLAILIKDIIGYKGGFLFNTDKPDSTMRKVTDVSKLHRLGWEHTLELEQGVKIMYEWCFKEGYSN